MNRIVVLSTDNNPNYFYYLPIVAHYWQKFRWEVHAFVTDDYPAFVYPMSEYDSGIKLHIIPSIENVRPGTLAQTVRHFAADALPLNAYIMVQDIDLIPLRPYEPDMMVNTIYGWELTGKSFIPVHYTGMRGFEWVKTMDLTGDLKADMERELKANGRAYKDKWEEYWDTDWDILTQKVLKRKADFKFVERGMIQIGKYKLPKGRVDRASIEVLPDGSYSWGASLNQSDLIDAHCENNNPASPEKWKMIKGLLLQVFGEVPAWMDEYTNQFYSKYGI